MGQSFSFARRRVLDVGVLNALRCSLKMIQMVSFVSFNFCPIFKFFI